MKKQPVISSSLASVGYDEKNEILEIEFNHGGLYQYFDVPKEEYEALMNAESLGRYYFYNIRDSYEFIIP